MEKSYNIIIAGVGGQGSLLASRIIGNVLLASGYDVKVSEVHGMSQRGGSVITYVRAGERVASPLVSDGECDLLFALEELESLRWLHTLKKGGALVASNQRIAPMPVITGAAVYPTHEEIVAAVSKVTDDYAFLPAVELAEQAGIVRASNVALIGCASTRLDIPEERWLDALRATVPPRFLEQNLKAFELGRDYTSK